MSYQDVRHWYEERDDEPEPVGRHDHEGPRDVFVTWFDKGATVDYYSGDVGIDVVQNGRWFPAERWAWKHALAWKAAMEKRHGHATIEEEF